MADIKISELGSAASVNDTDVIPMTASGITVKATASLLKNYMGVGALSSLATDDKTSLVNAINEVDSHADATQQMIAPVLSALVAPAGGLASGDQFIYNGLLYKATAAIAAGGTITINGNCEIADDLTKQINQIDNFILNKTPVLLYAQTNASNTVRLKFKTVGPLVYGFIFGRFGYSSKALSMAIISHAALDEAAIKFWGDRSATVSCSGNIVTITTQETYANFWILLPNTYAELVD